MAKNRIYDLEFKAQAVKLAGEIGAIKAAKELGISKSTLYTWDKAVRDGRLNLGPGMHSPASALSLNEEIQ